VLRVFRAAEGGLKALPLGNAKRENMPFTCQVTAGRGGGGVDCSQIDLFVLTDRVLCGELFLL
jgi:hypothetical protein